MWTSAVEIFLHITHRSLHEIASRQSCCLLIEACAIEGKQQAVLGRIGNVMCDGVEVDGVRERRGCAQAVYGGGGTQTEARAVGVCTGRRVCRQQGALGESARACRRLAASTREGSGHAGGV